MIETQSNNLNSNHIKKTLLFHFTFIQYFTPILKNILIYIAQMFLR